MAPAPEPIKTKAARFDLEGEDEEDEEPAMEQADHFSPATTPDEASTPTFSQSFGSIKRQLSFAALRELEMKQIHSTVWRRPNPKKGAGSTPRDFEQVLAYALTGGARSLLLGCSLRAGVNLVVVALRITKKRGISGRLILEALFGQDTMRFGLMLGSFSFL